MSILMPSKRCEPAKSIVLKVSNESTFFNFFMWPRVMMLNRRQRCRHLRHEVTRNMSKNHRSNKTPVMMCFHPLFH